jgi:cytochrome c553
MRFPKSKTPRDKPYLAWLRKQPCAFCMAPPPSEVSHHGLRGISIKPSDHEALPACKRCHTRHHQQGSPAPRFDALAKDARREAYAHLAEWHRKRYERGA